MNPRQTSERQRETARDSKGATTDEAATESDTSRVSDLHTSGGNQNVARGGVGSVGGTPAGRAFSQAASGGMGRDYPYRSELESFFSADLSGLRAVTASSGALETMGADAAYAGGQVVFSQASPSRAQAAHEAAHYLQDSGGAMGAVARDGGAHGREMAGTTSRSEAAEVEASAAGRAFAGGGSAPALTAGFSGVARDGTGTPLERLRESANGNWIGDVDEEACLGLINQLDSTQRQQVRDDHALMGKLVGAFNQDEMRRALEALEVPLIWRIYWMERAGEVGNLPATTWLAWFQAADAGQQQSAMSYELTATVFPRFRTPARQLFDKIANTPAWATSLAANRWLVESIVNGLPGDQAAVELGGVAIPDGSIPGICTQLAAIGWDRFVSRLPRGSGIPQPARAALRRFKDHADAEAAKKLFEQRFDKALTTRYENAGGDQIGWLSYIFSSGAREITWRVEDIRRVWDQLDLLPDADVSDNSVLRAFQAISGDRGFWSGDSTVQLGQGLRGSTMGPTRLEHTVRHEIGHAVHSQIPGQINPWLQGEIGFWYLNEGHAGLRSLITALGGWPATYNDASGTAQPFGATQQNRILAMLTDHTGSAASFTAASALPAATGPATTDDQRYWQAMPAAVHTCFSQSASRWYNNYTAMPTGTNGKYFYNHWYKKPYYFSANAETAIGATGDNYSAMSEKEFFANCYAEYFANPAGYNDHTQWGGRLSGSVKAFFARVVVDRQPYVAPTGALAGGAGTGGTAPAGGAGGSPAPAGAGGPAPAGAAPASSGRPPGIPSGDGGYGVRRG